MTGHASLRTGKRCSIAALSEDDSRCCIHLDIEIADVHVENERPLEILQIDLAD